MLYVDAFSVLFEPLAASLHHSHCISLTLTLTLALCGLVHLWTSELSL